MKELSIEEKAKAYDEAIGKFDVILNLNTVKESGTIFADDVRKILPELAESEDEKCIRLSTDIIDSALRAGFCVQLDRDRCVDWLKSLKERVQPQSKQEWGEEDEKTIEEAIGYLEKYAEERVQGGNSKQYIFSLASRLDHLRPQSTWKPSDWQMLAINTAISIFGNDTLTRKCLIELHEQLKKLREE